MRGLFKNTGAWFATLMTTTAATTTLFSGQHAFAQTSTETMSVQAPALAPPVSPADATGEVKAKVLQNFKYEDTSGITDLRLRAEQGSLSRYSGKFSFGYQGPVIDDLSNPYQPDPDGSITHNPTSLRGNVSFRSRWSSESAINLGTGISRVTPFSEGSRTDISTPFISFDHTDRVRAYQFRESIEGSMVTNPEMRNVGQYGGLAGNFSVMRNINYSRWEVGVDTNFQMGLYGRPYDPGPPIPQKAQQTSHGGRRSGGIMNQQNIGDGNASTFSAGLGPSVRFRISDKFGSFASVHFSYFEPRSSQGQFQIQHKTMTGRTGIDVAITHDVFFSPFLTYYPDSISLSTTSLNFSTIFSIF